MNLMKNVGFMECTNFGNRFSVSLYVVVFATLSSRNELLNFSSSSHIVANIFFSGPIKMDRNIIITYTAILKQVVHS